MFGWLFGNKARPKPAPARVIFGEYYLRQVENTMTDAEIIAKHRDTTAPQTTTRTPGGCVNRSNCCFGCGVNDHCGNFMNGCYYPR